MTAEEAEARIAELERDYALQRKDLYWQAVEAEHRAERAEAEVAKLREAAEAAELGAKAAEAALARVAGLVRTAEAYQKVSRVLNREVQPERERLAWSLLDAASNLPPRAEARCHCQWEAGDSPCPMHGDE